MKNLFKRALKGPSVEERLAALETLLSEQTQAREIAEAELLATKKKADQELANANTELVILKEKQKEYDNKRNSNEPWVEVIGETVDPVKGIEIKLDWNDKFIDYLKESGIKASDEDTIVQKWLAMLYHDLFEKLEQKVIDNSDKKTDSDFF